MVSLRPDIAMRDRILAKYEALWKGIPGVRSIMGSGQGNKASVVIVVSDQEIVDLLKPVLASEINGVPIEVVWMPGQGALDPNKAKPASEDEDRDPDGHPNHW